MNLLMPWRENHNYFHRVFDKLGRVNWVNEIAVVGTVEQYCGTRYDGVIPYSRDIKELPEFMKL